MLPGADICLRMRCFARHTRHAACGVGINVRGIAGSTIKPARLGRCPPPFHPHLCPVGCRLGLERGATAAEAVDAMVQLLEEHGQGGACEEGGG